MGLREGGCLIVAAIEGVGLIVGSGWTSLIMAVKEAAGLTVAVAEGCGLIITMGEGLA